MYKTALIGSLAALVTAGAAADLELSVDTEYPRHLELKVPVEQDSDFQVHGSFGRGEFFTATGHVGRITWVNTNRSVSLIYGYQYKLGSSQGAATGSQEEPLNSEYSLRIISSIWDANPRFVVHEIPAPPRPNNALTNKSLLTNVTLAVPSNSKIKKP